MTTAEIESMADPSGAATADLNLKLELRHRVIPEFFEDVGYVAWRRRHITKTLLANGTYVDVTDSTYTFSHIKELYLSPYWTEPLEYIGEDPVEVLKAKANTIAARPTKFFLESSGTRFERVSFDCPSDQTYTVAMTVDIHILWPDNSSSVDLSPYIPPQFQAGLVDGLRKFVYRERFGIGDQRYQEAAESFERWKMRANKSKELARSDKPKFAR